MMTQQDIERLRDELARLKRDARYIPNHACCECAREAADDAYEAGVEHVCDKLDAVLRSAETDNVLQSTQVPA